MSLNRSFYRRETGCGCGGNGAVTDSGETLPAMAFVPVQTFGAVYEADAGFPRGTIFPELDKPFLAVGGMRCGV